MQMMGLESLQDNPEAHTGIASTFEKIKQDRVVSQSDIAPFIQYFPMTVSISNFDEQPSPRGLEIALEGFAMLFKVTAGVILVSVLGVCIYNFIRSRKNAESTSDMATNATLLNKELFKLMDGIRKAPGYQVRTQPLIDAKDIPLGFNNRSHGLSGQVNFQDWADRFYTDGYDQHFTNAIASKIASGKFDSITLNLMQLTSDYMSDLAARVKNLRMLVKEIGPRVLAGQLEKLEHEIRGLDTAKIRGTLLKGINQIYDKVLPSPKGSFRTDSSQLLEDRAQQLKTFFDQTKDDKNFVKEHYQENADRWRQGDIEGMLGKIPEICAAASTLGSAPSLSTGKNIVNECEELRRQISPLQIPEAIDQALKDTLEDIRLDSISSMAIFDMVINEQRQFTIYIQDILNLTVELAAAVAAFSRPTDPSLSKRLANDAVAAGKASRKVKV
jgi:hypothetical protein